MKAERTSKCFLNSSLFTIYGYCLWENYTWMKQRLGACHLNCIRRPGDLFSTAFFCSNHRTRVTLECVPISSNRNGRKHSCLFLSYNSFLWLLLRLPHSLFIHSLIQRSKVNCLWKSRSQYHRKTDSSKKHQHNPNESIGHLRKSQYSGIRTIVPHSRRWAPLLRLCLRSGLPQWHHCLADFKHQFSIISGHTQRLPYRLSIHIWWTNLRLNLTKETGSLISNFIFCEWFYLKNSQF